MRISKDPEIRKQEIIDTAMKLFSEKGYEFTSISDIAREMNVVSGLCYRYFKSKEELYKTALNMYAEQCSAPIIRYLSQDYENITDFLNQFSDFFITHNGKQKYHNFFDNSKNEHFHRELDLIMIKSIEPYAVSLLEKWMKQKIINIDDPKYTAKFLLYGEMPIINDNSLSPEKKIELLKKFMLKLLM